MIIKVIVQEESPMNEDQITYMRTTHEVSSDDKKVIAATLRALANNYDPPQAVHRRGLPTIYKGTEE